MIGAPVATLDGAPLAWAVAIAEGREPILQPPAYGLPWRVAVVEAGRLIAWRPERDWSQGGALIRKYDFEIIKSGPGFAVVIGWDEQREVWTPWDMAPHGPDHLIAACRARVFLAIGETVELPPELAPVQVAA